MIKIGEFAKICGVNIQTLRYYDKIGLLCADMVDDSSGYRYYKPEKLQMFGTITHLKHLGFSLDEIRQFLGSSYEEQCGMYQTKKRALTDSIRLAQEKIVRIDEACENAKRSVVPINKQMLNLPFEDDPDVIGRWDYCGNTAIRTKFDSEDSLEKRDCFPESLFFRPGGSPVWMYFWTKGTIYCMLEEYNVILPHSYRIFTHNSVKYMAVDWMEDRFASTHTDDTLRIYRQTDTHMYTEKETYRFTDDVDLPYIPDDRVLGEWETVDVLKDKAAFSVKRIKGEQRSREPKWLAGMKFYPRGMCIKTINRNSGSADLYFNYTAGTVIDEKMEHAEQYEIVGVHGTDYLILEHKSCDYSYLGKIFCYYVLRRKSV